MTTPADYPLRYAPGEAGLVRLAEADYRVASFLDERLLDGGRRLVWRPWSVLAEAQPVTRTSHFVFHIGHVGSTLLSRLLGEHPALFSVREPALLRAVARGEPAPPVGELVRVFGRVWRSEQTALVKATSFVSEIGPELMHQGGGQALLLAVTPPVYLRTILGGSASPQEAERLAPLRRGRLARRLGVEPPVRSLGELVAMSWLCEMLSLADIAGVFPDRCRWLDFDQMLAAPDAALSLALAHFGCEMAGQDRAALLAGPMMSRYAKAPEHGYDAALRQRVLAEAAQQAAGEVQRGMDWLGGLSTHPRVRAVLGQAAAMSRKLDMPAAA